MGSATEIISLIRTKQDVNQFQRLNWKGTFEDSFGRYLAADDSAEHAVLHGTAPSYYAPNTTPATAWQLAPRFAEEYSGSRDAPPQRRRCSGRRGARLAPLGIARPRRRHDRAA